MEKALLAMGPEELKRMIADEVDGAELVCHFCNEKYYIAEDELNGLAASLQNADI